MQDKEMCDALNRNVAVCVSEDFVYFNILYKCVRCLFMHVNKMCNALLERLGEGDSVVCAYAYRVCLCVQVRQIGLCGYLYVYCMRVCDRQST